MTGALAGLRVLDLTRLLPGAYCTMLLADLGADVVKVEQPGVGDGLRLSPPFAGSGESGAHLVLDRGKRSVTVDLKHPRGRDLVLRLATTRDLLVESFRPGVMDRLGLGQPDLLAANPRLVTVSITAYGQSGPRVAEPGHDVNALAVSGVLSLMARPGPLPIQAADLTAGLLAALGGLAALRARDAGEPGQHVDIAMSDAALALTPLALGEYVATGRAPGPDGPVTGGLACYGVYACGDGLAVAVGALEHKFFARLCALLDMPDAAGLQYDPTAQPGLRDRLAQAFGSRPRADWLALLDGEDVCVTPVLDLEEAMADAGARARSVIAEGATADGRRFARTDALPLLSATPGRAGTTAPGLGADVDEVLAEAGLGAGEVAELRSLGVV